MTCCDVFVIFWRSMRTRWDGCRRVVRVACGWSMLVTWWSMPTRGSCASSRWRKATSTCDTTARPPTTSAPTPDLDSCVYSVSQHWAYVQLSVAICLLALSSLHRTSSLPYYVPPIADWRLKILVPGARFRTVFTLSLIDRLSSLFRFLLGVFWVDARRWIIGLSQLTPCTVPRAGLRNGQLPRDLHKKGPPHISWTKIVINFCRFNKWYKHSINMFIPCLFIA